MSHAAGQASELPSRAGLRADLGAPYHQGVENPSQAGLEENNPAPLQWFLALLSGLDPWESLGWAPGTAGGMALAG